MEVRTIMNQLRVLHILPNFGPGGAERMAVNLMRASTTRGKINVASISLYKPIGTDLEDLLAGANIPVWYLEKRPGPDLTMFRKIGNVLKQYRPDIVHTHLSVLRYCLLPCKLLGVKGIVHTVHSIAQKEVDLFGKQIHRLAFASGVLPVAIADEVGASISKVYKRNTFATVPNGIPVQVYESPTTSRKEWRKQAGFSPDDLLLVSVATLSRVKNHSLLLRAFKAVLAEIPSSRLLLVGEGAQRSTLEAEAKSLGTSNQVQFMGLRRDVPDILSAADIFVMASDWEGNPLSVMEAMAAGKPVVSTAVGGIPELVQHEHSGLLVQRGDSTQLASSLIRLGLDHNMRHLMGERARQEARQRFDVSLMAESYEEIYTALMARARRS